MAVTNRMCTRAFAAAMTIGALAGCSDMDLDFRSVGNGFDTSEAALQGRTAQRPAPDDRGLISYPGYQVAIARRGDTVSDVAARVGVQAEELARFNGLPDGLPLRSGETLVVPRAGEPTGNADLAALAGNAIERAADGSAGTIATQPLEQQPLQHRVQAGETAFSIARLYRVSPRALADWNGLDSEFSVRQGQVLLIPVTVEADEAERVAAAAPAPAAVPVTTPGSGSVAPEPPSAATPLPVEEPVRAAPAPAPAPASPDLGTERADTSRLAMPVAGSIVRTYKREESDGIGIAAIAGASVKAAEAGTVAAITRDTEGVPIVVVRHEGSLLTVYAGVGEVSVEKGATVRRGQEIARMSTSGQQILHFEVREGLQSVDPAPLLN